MKNRPSRNGTSGQLAVPPKLCHQRVFCGDDITSTAITAQPWRITLSQCAIACANFLAILTGGFHFPAVERGLQPMTPSCCQCAENYSSGARAFQSEI